MSSASESPAYEFGWSEHKVEIEERIGRVAIFAQRTGPAVERFSADFRDLSRFLWHR